MADYNIASTTVRVASQMVREVVVSSPAPPPDPRLCVSRNPGPVLTSAQARVGGQPGHWGAPLLKARIALGPCIQLQAIAL